MSPRPAHLSPLGALVLLAASGCDAAPDATHAAAGRGLVFVSTEDSTIGPLPGTPAARPYFHDFGSVPDGVVVEHVFRLRNTDPGPVAIKRIVSSCGCTVPLVRYVDADGRVVEGEPTSSGADELISIPPGALAEIELRVDTGDIRLKNIDKLLMVTVTTDSENGYYIQLETHILVSRPFETVPHGFDFGRVPVNGGAARSVEVVQAGGFDHAITEVLEHPTGVMVELVPADRLGRRVWTVTARIEPPLALGIWRGELRLGTRTVAGEPGRELVIPMTAMGVLDIQCDPARLAFRADPETAGEFLATLSSLLPGHRLRVVGAEVEAEHAELLSLSFEPVEPAAEGRSGNWGLVMRTRPPFPAAEEILRGDARLTLDDLQNPEVVVPYVVHLR